MQNVHRVRRQEQQLRGIFFLGKMNKMKQKAWKPKVSYESEAGQSAKTKFLFVLKANIWIIENEWDIWETGKFRK